MRHYMGQRDLPRMGTLNLEGKEEEAGCEEKTGRRTKCCKGGEAEQNRAGTEAWGKEKQGLRR